MSMLLTEPSSALLSFPRKRESSVRQGLALWLDSRLRGNDNGECVAALAGHTTGGAAYLFGIAARAVEGNDRQVEAGAWR
jgi:hypothetical protein